MENPFEIILKRLDAIEQLLREIKYGKKEPIQSTEFGKEFMNVSQVAEYLSLSVSTVYGLTHRMEIPNYKRGKRLCFKKVEIDDWLTETRRSTQSEIEKEAANYIMKHKKPKF